MKSLVGNEIQQAIVRCNPLKIAVAFIGIDWPTFIPAVNDLEAVIVSPTLGSNPRAISDLAKQIKWEKLFFLDELHAKMYVGKNSSIIGSANLTHNGLSGRGLIELCVEINDGENLAKVNQFFDDLKKCAYEQYPTENSKKAKLKELEKIWGTAIANQLARKMSNAKKLFTDFELLGEDHFYVFWYQTDDCEYSEEVKAIQSVIEDDIHFAKGDKLEKNKWALLWRITDESTPHKKVPLSWMYIHEIFEDGVIDSGYDYPNCAIQRKDLDCPDPPFELTKNVVAAFKKAVQDKDIAKYLVQEGDVFSLANSQKGVPTLINRMREYLDIS